MSVGKTELRRVTAVRYVTPLREGGSLPAIVEADDGQLYVVKFRGAGQGERALVAEVLAGGFARALGLPMPEPVLLELDAALARTEPDPEISELLQKSVGLNFGLGYLAGSVGFTRGADAAPAAALASAIVAFDAFVMNVDRTVRNPNLLMWKSGLWLIDHGAALYWQHGFEPGDDDRGADRFALVRTHVLLPWADAVPEAARTLGAGLDDGTIDAVIDSLPEAWLTGEPGRALYRQHFRRRRDEAVRGSSFVEEAVRARASLV